MLKSIQIITLIVLFLIAGFTCKKENDYPISGCLKGRLEIKGICMNYVISIQQGNFDPGWVEASWQDPATGNSYQNVFSLGSYCSFPANIDEGDEFSFYVVNKEDQNCAVCLAYRPKPQKHLVIRVRNTPCN